MKMMTMTLKILAMMETMTRTGMMRAIPTKSIMPMAKMTKDSFPSKIDLQCFVSKLRKI
jgi:hypothetical protein